MKIQAFKLLSSPLGETALQAAVSRKPLEKDYLTHCQEWSKTFPPGLAQAALETAILRIEAVDKFGEHAGRMFFTRESLEQATSFEVGAYRAERFAPFTTVLDLGCSIGGDLVHLAQNGRAMGIDLDPLRLAMARANLGAFGRKASLVQADLAAPLPVRPGRNTAVFFDPARRENGRRIPSIRRYRPSFDFVEAWRGDFPALGVKVSPGVDLAELEGLDCQVEFISQAGALKEASLWFGPLRDGGSSATLLPGPHRLAEDPAAEQRISDPLAYLYEPDPAVLRAGLVTTLGARLDAFQLDPAIAYLTGDLFIETPFARAWAVQDWMPFNLKKLRAYIRERNIGKVVVKKRGSPIQPEELIAALRLKGDNEAVIVLTQLAGRPAALICKNG